MKNIVLILSLFLLSNCADTNAQNRPPKGEKAKAAKGYKVGDKATDFTLKNVDGKSYTLSEIKDAKGYIVVFTSNVCPFAIAYQDRLIELHNDMAPKGYPVVAVNSNDPSMAEGDSFENMKIRASEKGFPFLYLEDEGQKIFPQYGATKTPHVFLLDQNFIVQYIGAIDDNSQSAKDVKTKYVRSAITALENGTQPDPNFTKAIGCPIKSKASLAGNGGPPPRGERGQRGERRGPPSPDQILERMDKNKDQKVSTAEAHGPLKEDFARLDKNEDGFLTKEELSAIKPRGRE